MVTPPDPLVSVPELIKLPPSVKRLAPGVNVAPVLIVNGTLALKSFGAPIVMAPVFAIITPPVAANGVIHSSVEAVLAVAVLY